MLKPLDCVALPRQQHLQRTEAHFQQGLCSTGNHSHQLWDAYSPLPSEAHFQVLLWVSASLRKFPGRGTCPLGREKKVWLNVGLSQLDHYSRIRYPSSKDGSAGSKDCAVVTEQTNSIHSPVS